MESSQESSNKAGSSFAKTSQSSMETVSGTTESFEKDIIDKNILELQNTLRPFILKLDESLASTRISQQNLNQELDHLMGVLEMIRQAEKFDTLEDEVRARYRLTGDIAADIELKSRQLLGLKRRLTLVHSILQTVNSRVKKLLLSHNSRINRP